MRIIDSHVHLYPPEVGRGPSAWATLQREAHWALLCARRRKDGQAVQSWPTVDQLIATMDAAGIERAVLLGWYWENPETCVVQNRFYASCVQSHPDRLSAFATWHPAAGSAQTKGELLRAHGEGLIGLGELSPTAQGFPADHPVFREMLEWAAEHQWPVTLHVTDPDSRRYPGWLATPADDLVGLATRFAGTTFILAHWGGLFPLNDTRFRGLTNVYYDTAASPLLYDASIWSRALPAIGAGRVLFGSDFPLNLYPRVTPEAELGRFVSEALAAGASAEVLAGNAAHLFGF